MNTNLDRANNQRQYYCGFVKLLKEYFIKSMSNCPNSCYALDSHLCNKIVDYKIKCDKLINTIEIRNFSYKSFYFPIAELHFKKQVNSKTYVKLSVNNMIEFCVKNLRIIS